MLVIPATIQFPFTLDMSVVIACLDAVIVCARAVVMVLIVCTLVSPKALIDLSCLLYVNCSATRVLHVACAVPAWLGCIAIVSVVLLMHLPLGTVVLLVHHLLVAIVP